MGVWGLARRLGFLGPLMVFARINFMRKTGRLLIVKYCICEYTIQVVVYPPGMQKTLYDIVCRSIFVERKLQGMHLRNVGIVSQQSL